MAYLVYCTFDLKGATATQYQDAYAELAKLGLQKVVKADDGGSWVIPTTSAMGFLEGGSAEVLRDQIRGRIAAAFAAKRFSAEIFVIVGGDWAWGVQRL